MLPVGLWMLVGGRGMSFMPFFDLVCFNVWLSTLALNTTLPAGNRPFLGRKQDKREESAEVKVNSSTQVSRNVQRRRTLPPFVLSRDSARGALYSLQALLVYALMLAVM